VLPEEKVGDIQAWLEMSSSSACAKCRFPIEMQLIHLECIQKEWHFIHDSEK
jgi:hypothetical protein